MSKLFLALLIWAGGLGAADEAERRWEDQTLRQIKESTVETAHGIAFGENPYASLVKPTDLGATLWFASCSNLMPAISGKRRLDIEIWLDSFRNEAGGYSQAGSSADDLQLTYDFVRALQALGSPIPARQSLETYVVTRFENLQRLLLSGTSLSGKTLPLAEGTLEQIYALYPLLATAALLELKLPVKPLLVERLRAILLAYLADSENDHSIDIIFKEIGSIYQIVDWLGSDALSIPVDADTAGIDSALAADDTATIHASMKSTIDSLAEELLDQIPEAAPEALWLSAADRILALYSTLGVSAPVRFLHSTSQGLEGFFDTQSTAFVQGGVPEPQATCTALKLAQRLEHPIPPDYKSSLSNRLASFATVKGWAYPIAVKPALRETFVSLAIVDMLGGDLSDYAGAERYALQHFHTLVAEWDQKAPPELLEKLYYVVRIGHLFGRAFEREDGFEQLVARLLLQVEEKGTAPPPQFLAKLSLLLDATGLEFPPAIAQRLCEAANAVRLPNGLLGPDKSLVDLRGSYSAWLFAQHQTICDFDFSRHYDAIASLQQADGGFAPPSAEMSSGLLDYTFYALQLAVHSGEKLNADVDIAARRFIVESRLVGGGHSIVPQLDNNGQANVHQGTVEANAQMANTIAPHLTYMGLVGRLLLDNPQQLPVDYRYPP